MGRLTRHESYFHKVFLYRFLSASSFTLLPPGIGRASFTWEFCVLLLERKRKVSVLFTSSVSQVPLTQNNHYAKAAYFGVACPELLHCNLIIFWYNCFHYRRKIMLHALFTNFSFYLIKQHCISEVQAQKFYYWKEEGKNGYWGANSSLCHNQKWFSRSITTLRNICNWGQLFIVWIYNYYYYYYDRFFWQ